VVARCAGFEELDTVPRMFVLMGNFQSYPATLATTDYDAVRQNFSALASVLQRHRRLVVQAMPLTMRMSTPRHASVILSCELYAKGLANVLR
jgi:hypothetical protein